MLAAQTCMQYGVSRHLLEAVSLDLIRPGRLYYLHSPLVAPAVRQHAAAALGPAGLVAPAADDMSKPANVSRFTRTHSAGTTRSLCLRPQL